MLEQMAALGLISLASDWKSWNDETKNATYKIIIGDQNVKFGFDTSTGKGYVVVGRYFQVFACGDFLLNESTNRVEVNLTIIKQIFDSLGIKFAI